MLENIDKLSKEDLELVQNYINSLIKNKEEQKVLTAFQKFQQLCY